MRVKLGGALFAVVLVLVSSLAQASAPIGKFPDYRLKLPLKPGGVWAIANMGELPGPVDTKLLSKAFVDEHFLAIDNKKLPKVDDLRARITVLLQQYTYLNTTVAYLGSMFVKSLVEPEVSQRYSEHYSAYASYRDEINARVAQVLVPMLAAYAEELSSTGTIDVTTDFHRIPEDPDHTDLTQIQFEKSGGTTRVSLSAKPLYLDYAMGWDVPYLPEQTWNIGRATVSLPLATAFPKRMKLVRESSNIYVPAAAFDGGSKSGTNKFPYSESDKRLVCRTWVKPFSVPRYARLGVSYAEINRFVVSWGIGSGYDGLSFEVGVAYVPLDFVTDRKSILRFCDPLPSLDPGLINVRPPGTCTCGMLPTGGAPKISGPVKYCAPNECSTYCDANGYDYYTHAVC